MIPEIQANSGLDIGWGESHAWNESENIFALLQ